MVDAGGHRLPAAPRRRCSTWSTAGRARADGRRGGRALRRPPRPAHAPTSTATSSDLRYEVMYFLEAPDESHRRVQGRVGGHRRLDRRRRRRRPLELPHPHRRHRRVDRGRGRRRAAHARSGSPTCIEQVEEEQWVREADGVAPSRCRPHVTEPVAHRGGRRRPSATASGASSASLGVQGDRDRRPVDEPVDGRPARRGRGGAGRRRS